MLPPPLCLPCGRLHARGEVAPAACPGCGEAPPRVTWQSTDSYRPVQRAGVVMGTTLGGIVLGGVALGMAIFALRAPSFGEGQILALALALILAVFAGIMFWAAGYTLLVRTHRYESADSLMYGEVSTLAGRVRTAFSVRYIPRPFHLPPAAARLTSASAHAAGPAALRARLDGVPSMEGAPGFRELDDTLTVATAAILGLAARGEIEVLPSQARIYWLERRPENAPINVRDRIFLRAGRGAAHAPPFERSFLAHLDARVAERRSDALAGAAPATYRASAPRDDAPAVELFDIVARVSAEADAGAEGSDPYEHLGALLAAAGGVDVVSADIADAMLAAVQASPAVAQAIACEASEGVEAVC